VQSSPSTAKSMRPESVRGLICKLLSLIFIPSLSSNLLFFEIRPPRSRISSNNLQCTHLRVKPAQPPPPPVAACKLFPFLFIILLFSGPRCLQISELSSDLLLPDFLVLSRYPSCPQTQVLPIRPSPCHQTSRFRISPKKTCSALSRNQSAPAIPTTSIFAGDANPQTFLYVTNPSSLFCHSSVMVFWRQHTDD